MSGNLDPNSSPSSAPRLSGGRGVRRLNRIPMMIVFAVCVVIILAVIYTFHQRIENEQAKEGSSCDHRPPSGQRIIGPGECAELGPYPSSAGTRCAVPAGGSSNSSKIASSTRSNRHNCRLGPTMSSAKRRSTRPITRRR